MQIDSAAKFTLDLFVRGDYVASDGSRVNVVTPHAAAMAGTLLYANTPTTPAFRGTPRVVVTDETTTEAMADMCTTGWRDVALLNFAAARNPGGGFLTGSRAQEEELCRCSDLYNCLLQPEVQAYYTENKGHPNTLYTDALIYSPGVVFFRLGATTPLLPTPTRCAVITCPAPNLRDSLPPDQMALVKPTFVRRWGRVLDVAATQGHRRLVLGAWGCGAFRNDPEVVVRAFKCALESRGGYFDEIRFAIPTRYNFQSQVNAEVFRGVLGGTLP